MSEATFTQDAYQVCRQVLSPNVVRDVHNFLENEVDKTLGPARKELGLDSEFPVSDLGKFLSQKNLSQATRQALSGHFSLESRLSEKLWSIPFEEKLQIVLKEILNTKSLFMHMPPVARFVLPQNLYAAVPAHQDVSYNTHMSDFVTVWIPLVDIDEHCGGVTIFKNSGSHPLMDVTQSDQYWLEGVPTHNYEPVHYEMKVGDVLIFNKYLIHASRPNVSNRVRYSLDCRFFGEKQHSTKHYLDLQTRKVIAPSQKEISRDNI